jgi:sigma-B regulation protein RsbU (phosphoserine phosphatase)
LRSKRKILAAEDDAISRRVLVRTLERLGATVLEADGGARALELIERERPEIVVTDWMMPDVDGLEVCRRLRASRPEGFVYAIVLTARTESADRIAAPRGSTSRTA